VVFEMDMVSPESLTPAPLSQRERGWGEGELSKTPREFGAFGVPSEVEPVSVHLTTTKAPALN